MRAEKMLEVIPDPAKGPRPRRTLRQRLHLTPDGGPARLYRALFGRPLANAEGETQKVGALSGVPILGLDALGSASYGPEAMLAILLPLGALGLGVVWEITTGIVALLAILYFSYRQTIAAYPNGGGSFTVAKENLGEKAGLVAAGALLLDYILNVAVAISAGVGALTSVFPGLHEHTLGLCLGVLTLVTFVNLRGVRESGLAWSVPTYAFMGSLLTVLGLGVWKAIQAGGHPVPVAPPAPLAAPADAISLWLILRAFASGCTAMTGVEAVSNAVPIFAEPRVRNARLTLTVLVAVLATLLIGVGYLCAAYGIGAMAQEQRNYQSVVSQLVGAVSGRGVLYFITMGSVLAVLTLSANTSFAGFPRVCGLLAQEGYLPHGFANVGRRLVYTVGIVVLFVLSAGLLIVFEGITDRLIPLFAVGAFGAFTLSQAGMVNHWRRRAGRGDASMYINGLGAVATAVALVIIIVAKFEEGAWVTLVVIPGLVLLFAGIKRHYRRVAQAIERAPELQLWKVRPLSVVIPFDGWNRVTEQAVRLAIRISDDITAVHVTPNEHYQDLCRTWVERVEKPASQAGVVVPRLEIIHSPYRQLFDPLLAFIEQVKAEKPENLIGVIIPELVQPRWWEYLLHNNVASGLKAVLLLKGGERLVVINAPWHLREPQ